ncbi:pyridoxamine phosphate oxidase [Ascosphaera apis ARSEF 7405]|uniref:Pyridoxamine phosphate oxidase n=1 Tax=Ascosphaera apis ARSEF 7405 TaxID=392613 RepID=A0A168CQS6_9EURO|nr:pyridoxamine phosphate oxidase [Ascosphaera apis ARSEF 7405]
MTTNPSSKKTLNLQSNPRVSLLVHDWVSHRPPTASVEASGEASSPPAATRSSLASLLMSLNTSALSSISTTITGTASFCDVGSEEERWCKERHLENNTFSEEGSDSVVRFGNVQNGAAQASVDDDARVVVVKFTEGRIADHKGQVRDWKLVQPEIEQFS